jgi:tetratricopeptide (TPR) repeat protein
MTYETALLSVTIALLSFQSAGQTDNRIKRKDSITVSAGIPKEQLALEEQLRGIVSQGDQLLRAGNASEAIKQYQIAVDMVQKQPLLAEQQLWVLNKLAGGYMQADRTIDAIPIYAKLLDAKKRDCESESTAVSNCAAAQYDLGTAKLQGADPTGALDMLQAADSNYAKAEKLGGDMHEFTMLQHMNEGQTKLLIAVAQYQTGKGAVALKTIEVAISELTLVESDETILLGIRDEASHSLQQAQTIRTRLSSIQ